MSDDRLTAEQFDILLTAAVAAPSMHNTQPWRFEVGGRAIDVFLDESRSLPAEDPSGRAMRIAAGAAVLNLRIAAAHLGLHTWYGLEPDPSRPGLVARVVVERSAIVDPELWSLYDEIPRRHTSRGPAPAADIPAPVRAVLMRAALAEGAELTWLDDRRATGVLDLIRDADLRGVGEWTRTAERRLWVGGSRTDDGVPSSALGPRSETYPGVVRDLAVAPWDRQRRTATFEKHPLLMILSTEGDRGADQVAAGMALQRVLLTATRHGLSASFLNQPLEYDDLCARVQAVTGKPGHAHMVIRLLRSRKQEPTPRRAVADVTTTVTPEPHDTRGV